VKKPPQNGGENGRGHAPDGTFLPGNSGGKAGRSGRRPLAITLAAQEVFEKHRLLDVAAGIARGTIQESWFDQDGQEHADPTKNSDRLAAIRFLAGYAFGNPQQVVTHEGAVHLTHEERKQSLERILGDRLKIA
jgi:hypothetical protein